MKDNNSNYLTAVLEEMREQNKRILEILAPFPQLQADVTTLKKDVAVLKVDVKIIKAAVTDLSEQVNRHEAALSKHSLL